MKAFRGNNNKKLLPARSELEVLQILWEFGPSTVRFVNDMLNSKIKPVQYTSTLKLMQLMAEKKMLIRDESSMKHIYSAAIEEQKTKGSILESFVQSMYNGSVGNLLVALLNDEKTSKKDLEIAKELLAKLDRQNKTH